jgi:hypothetical protein
VLRHLGREKPGGHQKEEEGYQGYLPLLPDEWL